jgi:uncharacterized membrane protein
LSWHAWLAWLEDSALGHAIRTSGVWTYAIINLVHILAIATLFGSILVLDLRLIGWRRDVDIATLASISKPLAAAGLAAAIVSGVCLLATNASEYANNPFLPIKLGAIAVGLLNVAALYHLTAWKALGSRDLNERERLHLAFTGAASLLSWLVAIAAGRMIGYW